LLYTRCGLSVRPQNNIQANQSLSVWCRGLTGIHKYLKLQIFANPGHTSNHPARAPRPTKQAAFAATWEGAGIRATVEVHEIARGIRDALAIDKAQLQHTARELVTQYRHGFKPVCAKLR
jgi:hypothetical protein